MKAWMPAITFIASGLVSAEPVRMEESERSFPVVDEGGGNPREMRLRQVRIENEYLRVDWLPQLGGRVRSVFDKAAGKELFLVRPIEWPPTRYTAYGSQLGGHEVNFPSFHHGNNYMDRWNWHVERESDGAAAVTVGWTDPLRRQRVVVRWQLRPGCAVLRARYRFANLNPQPLGFAPWSNMFFGYADDLQYIIPTSRVAPHGFNDGSLKLMPWPWPDWDEKSVCFWRNIPGDYNSIFAVGLEEDFHGVYYTRADHGMVRLFDRTCLPGIKMFCYPPRPGAAPAATDLTEVWTSPVSSHEDMLWWEAFGVREYEEAFFGVHGIGGYRYANEAGAVNLNRGEDAVEAGVCVTRPLPGAVVTLSSVDGDWLREAADLSPEKPWRGSVKRCPGREPLELRVFDGDGRCVLEYAQRPDPGLRREPRFTGGPLWTSSPYHEALKAEQYHALWRGPTGGYGDFGAQGARAFRALAAAEPEKIEFALGLARSLLTDVQIRQPGQPRVGTAEETANLAERNLAEAAGALVKASRDPRAAVLLGEIRLRQGDRAAARECFAAAPGDPVAAFELSRLAAAGGDRQEALRYSAAAVRLLPASPAVIQLHAANLIEADRHAEARTLLEKLVARDPVDAVAVHMLSLAERAPDERERWAAAARALRDQTDSADVSGAAAPPAPPFEEGARAFERWLDSCLDGLDRQLPAIAGSAARAARLYVEKGFAIATRGDPGVRAEATGRSGGIMEMNFSRPSPITLQFPTDAKDLAASPRSQDDRPVVTFAPRWMVDQVRADGWPDDSVIITHAAEGGGLFARRDGRRLVDIDGVAAVAALWVWTGEFVAACTRLGKMPCMYQGFAVPGGKERAERLTKVDPKFHVETPQPVPAGKLGKAYIEALRRDLAAVYGERPRIQRLAEWAVETLEAGRASYIYPPTHLLFVGHVGGPFDPGYFTRINDLWSLDRKVPLARGDLVFYNGFDEIASDGDRAHLRAAGVRLAWSFSGYKTDAKLGAKAVAEGELFIDQHWKHGDAVVEVPGYDIKILPTSGVVTETILRLVEAEIVRIAAGKPASEIRPAPGPPARADVFHMKEGLISLETVVVGDPGNPPDPSGRGAVPYRFKIGKYEVTNAQYVEFLNAKAKVDSKTEPPFRLYNSDMEEGMGCRIRRSGSNGQYSYSVDPEHANRPVNMVSYWDACRFVNWLHNGQGDGDTETGAYALGGQNGLDGTAIRRSPGARWFLPSEDEWCKAAYFDPRKPGGPGYWKYPTRSDEKPGRDPASPNAANYYDGGYLDPARYTLPVGTFGRAASPYGTLDQAGNLFEWNEALISPPFRGVRGGSFGNTDAGLNLRLPFVQVSSPYEGEIVGFRVAGAVDRADPPADPRRVAAHLAPGKLQRRPWRNPEDGRPFYPLGWFAWHSDEADLEDLARDGANMVLFVEAPTEVHEARFPENLKRMLAYLDRAHTLGIKVLIQCGWQEDFGEDDPRQLARIQQYIEAVSKRPALLGYQLYDEPEFKHCGFKEPDRAGLLAFLDRLAKVRDAIRGADPNPHRTVQCVFNYIPNEGIGIGDWKPFLPVIDAFQVDRYPIATETPYFPQGDWGALRVAWQIAHALEAVEGSAHLNPAPVLQGIGLSYFEGGAAHWRDPLYDETRYMAYSALASGGWGTIHWIRGASSPGIRRNVARLYAELRQLLPALEASWERPPFAVSHNHEGITRGFLPGLIPDIATLALEDDAHYYLIAVDNSAVFLDVTFRMKLPGLEKRGDREAVVLNEDWGRKLAFDEKTGEWEIPPHTMRYGDVNIWVIGKK